MSKSIIEGSGLQVNWEDPFDKVVDGMPSEYWQPMWLRRNAELAYWTQDPKVYMVPPVRVTNRGGENVLVLSTYRVPGGVRAQPPHKSEGELFQYVGGGINTQLGQWNSPYLAPDSRGFVAPYIIEFELYFPELITGMFPAVWELNRIPHPFPEFPSGGRGWSDGSGENDYVEILGREHAAGSYRTHHTIHRVKGTGNWSKTGFGEATEHDTPLTGRWIHFACIVDLDCIEYYVDHQLARRVDRADEFGRLEGKVPMDKIWPFRGEYNNHTRILINNGVGGNWAGGPADPDDFDEPKEMHVRYIRQLTPTTGGSKLILPPAGDIILPPDPEPEPEPEPVPTAEVDELRDQLAEATAEVTRLQSDVDRLALSNDELIEQVAAVRDTLSAEVELSESRRQNYLAIQEDVNHYLNSWHELFKYKT